MAFLRHIPNLLTLFNLFSGCMALVFVFNEKLHIAAFFVFAGAVFDFIDGLAARALNVSSPLGKQLDSLADMVTFGVVPGSIIFMFLLNALYPDENLSDISSDAGKLLILLPAFIVTLFAALRLGKFNIDTRQSEDFIGLPTPSMTLFVASLPLILHYQPEYSGFILNLFFLYAIIPALSFLMVAEIPMFGMKIKDLGWQSNKARYLFIGVALIAIIMLKFAGLALAIILYVIFSIINNLFKP